MIHNNMREIYYPSPVTDWLPYQDIWHNTHVHQFFYGWFQFKKEVVFHLYIMETLHTAHSTYHFQRLT